MTDETATIPALDAARSVWTSPQRPPHERLEALLDVMTLEEKVAQLGGTWLGSDEHNASDDDATTNVDVMYEAFGAPRPWEETRALGIGHLTRVFGTRPIDPRDGVRRLSELQRDLQQHSRLGIPAIAHEECLTGFTTLGATVYPTPLAMAATFNPSIVTEVSTAIGTDLRAVDVHQGLSPVLDVVRDQRWGRVEETMGEDPYLVSVIATAYVSGLESAGVVATLKHFAGYSASRAARNHAPVPMGSRELADVMLVPFEAALRLGGARSVMNSYADIDGVPPAADPTLLTGVLRDQWGFEGTVVSDYASIAFLMSMHGVADTVREAGAQALTAGIDVELPEQRCYGAELVAAVRAGRVDEALVDRAVERVLRQKLELGLLDASWKPRQDTDVDLDAPANRALARRLAEQSIILLDNTGALPLASPPRTVAVVGPCADDPRVFLGCYSYPNHVLSRYPDLGLGVPVPSLREALDAELPSTTITHVAGCDIQAPDPSGIPAAVDAARGADLTVLAVGDLPGMFGRGSSGEGNDAEDLALPGVQADLARAILDGGTPVVLVVVSGRPYALGGLAERSVAVVQAFLPGEEGGSAIAGVLAGRIAPSGRLPVQIPESPGGQPATYLHPRLGEPGIGISTADTIVRYPFGHGMAYTTFEYSDLSLDPPQIAVDGETTVSCIVGNTGDRAGTEVVQLYARDPVAQVVRPVRQLLGFCRVDLAAGQRARVSFRLAADIFAYVGRDGRRIVDAGDIEIAVGASSADLRLRGVLRLDGTPRTVGHDRALTTPATVTPVT